MEWIDLGRLVAACAVIWIHAAESEMGKALVPVCRFAVPFFVVGVVWFSLQQETRANGETWTGFFKQRVTRLYVPFLFWSAIYLALRLFKHRLTGGGSTIDVSPALLVNGTAHHLWFLPLALVLSLACFPLATALWQRPRQQQRLIGWLSVVAALIVGLAPSPIDMDVERNPVSYFIGLSWDALPAAFLAVPLFLALRTPTQKVIGLMGFVVWAGACAINSLWRVHPLTSAVAGIALFVALSWQPSPSLPKSFLRFAKLTFTVYLVHVLYVEGLQVVLSRGGFNPSFHRDILICGLALVASLMTGFALRKVRVLKPVVV